MRLNQKAQHCSRCDFLVEPAQGELIHYDQEYLDDNDIFDVEPGWHVYCIDESACQARVEAQRQERLAVQAAAAAYEEAKQRLFRQEEGEYARGEQGRPIQIPVGVQIRDGKGFSIYGGGCEWIIEPDEQHVWYISRNGMDGDDWRQSNTTLGIGRRFPLTPERRAFLDPLRPVPIDRAEATRRIVVAARLDPALWPPEEAIAIRKPDGVWVAASRGYDAPCLGRSMDRRWVYARVRSHAAHDGDVEGDIHRAFMKAGIESSDNVSSYYVQWPATPERLAVIDADLPAWVGTPAPGRYLIGKSAISYAADNGADALAAANCWRIPVTDVEFTPDITLVHVDKRLLIWSDDAVTPLAEGLGRKLWSQGRDERDLRFTAHVEPGWPEFPPVPAEDPRLLTEAGSRLVRLALATQEVWGGRLQELYDILEISEEMEIDEGESRGISSGSWWKIKRLNVRWRDGQERLLIVATQGWWSRGEDADADESSKLFESTAAARS
jgi:hypothetical protein